jgi:hypothetical protein
MTRKGILEYHNRDCQCYTLGRRKNYNESISNRSPLIAT